MNVLILQGGDSPERAVSLRSAGAVTKAARELGHQVETYDPQEGLDGIAPMLARNDVVFPVLHGVGGEDGTIQAVLESYHAAFVGSGSDVSRRCFDKITTKQVLRENSLPTPAWAEVTAESLATAPLTQAPYVLKPRGGGSSIDTFIVRQPSTATVDMEVFQRHGTMLCEALVAGTELTVAVLGNEALPVIEIVPPTGKEFDYDNKYNGATEELCPPRNISEALQETAQSLAEQTHQALGARHFSRVDLMLSPEGKLFILEINTIPGLTAESLFPKAAACGGLPMTTLVERLLDMALHGERPGRY